MTSEERIERIEAGVELLRMRFDSRSSRVWDVATKVAVPVVMGLVGWMWQIDRQQVGLAGMIQANANGLIETRRNVDSLPPEYLRSAVSTLTTQNVNILQRLSAVEAELRTLQDK